MAKGVVVVDVVISQGNCRDALCDQCAHAMNCEIWFAVIDKAGGDGVEQVHRLVDVAQQQGASIRGNRSAIKTGDNFVAVKAFKLNLINVRVCLHRTPS